MCSWTLARTLRQIYESLMKSFEAPQLENGHPLESSATLNQGNVDRAAHVVNADSELSLSYVIESDDEIFEIFEEDRPAKLMMGSDTLSPFLQKFLLGKKVGEEFSFDFAASMLFGPYNLKLRFQMALPNYLRIFERSKKMMPLNLSVLIEKNIFFAWSKKRVRI